MNDFPTLNTGAVSQYPSRKAIQFQTSIVRFLDGSEQRYREFARPIRRWIISLEKLEESELHSLREFFRGREGAAQSFSFVDPWDGTSYPDCTLEGDSMTDQVAGDLKGRTSLTVRQSRV